MDLNEAINNKPDVIYLKSRNIIPYPYSETTKTEGGITYTEQDGGIKINGTATSESNYYIANIIMLEKGKTYTLSSNSELPVIIEDKSCTQFEISIISPVTFTAQYTEYCIYIPITEGQIISNVMVYPQLELGNKPTGFHKREVMEVNKIIYNIGGINTVKWEKGYSND